MRKRNLILMLMLALLVGAGLSTQPVQAATTVPSITIIRRQAVQSATTTQQTVPQAGIVYVIDAMAVTPKSEADFDLSDASTYRQTVLKGSAARHYRVVTGRDGKAQVAGVQALPKGYYRVMAVGHPADAVTVTVPYKVGKTLRYDVVIEPKAGLAGNVKPTPVKTKTRAKLLQTSGQTARLPYWLIAAGLLGALALGVGAANALERWRAGRKEARS